MHIYTLTSRAWHKLVLTLALVAGFAFGAITLPEVAHADTPNCVSISEFRAVKDGWSQKRVNRKFDTSGTPLATVGQTKSVKYKACWTNDSKVHVYYTVSDGAWRVYDKDRPAL